MILKTKQDALHNKIMERAMELGYNSEEIAPILDGVNCDRYVDAKLKILWVMKEPYDEIIDGKPKGGGWAMYDYTLALPMFRTMAKIVYGIMNEKYYNEIPEPDEDMLKLLQSTAFINICKMPGYPSSSKEDLKHKLNEWQDILQEQLDLYKPDIIILGNTYEELMEGKLNENPCTDWRSDASLPGKTAVLKNKYGQVIVDTFHPSPMRKCSRADLTDEVYINSIIHGVLTALKD